MSAQGENVMGTIKTVAVVMATYNGEKFLKQQIDSVLKQKGVDVHLLIRDDGSTDATQDILNQYQKENKLTWYTGKHLNVAYGFLDILKNSPRMDYYAFCDQDDVWNDDKLLNAIELLNKEDSKKPLLYYSSTTLVDENLQKITTHQINVNRNDLGRFFYIDSPGHTYVMNNILREKLTASIPMGIEIHDRWTVQVCLATGGICIGDTHSYVKYRQHGKNTIGMDITLKDKIKKFVGIVQSRVDPHFQLLHEYFSSELVSPYREMLDVLTVNNNKMSKFKFLKKFNIKLGSPFFNLAFRMHILFLKGHKSK